MASAGNWAELIFSLFKIKTKQFYLFLRRFIFYFFVPPFLAKEKNPFEKKEIKKILVIRIDRLGDVVVSLSAIKMLRQTFPDAKISVLVRAGNNVLLVGVPEIDEVILYQGFIKTVRQLRKRQFDLSIDLLMDYPLKAAWLAYLSKPKITAGFDIAGRGRLFNFKLNPAGEKKHVSQHILDLVTAIVKKYSDRDILATSLYPEIPISGQNREELKSFLKEKGIEAQELLVGIHPGGNYPSQRWPVERFSELADRLIKKYQAKIIIVGSSDEGPLIEKLLSLMQEDAVKFVNLSLDKLTALISLMDIFICNNSGPLHLAGALNVPTVSTMGPTDPILWWPMGKKHIVLRKYVPCSPCNRAICRTHQCLRLISVDEMLDAASDLLQERINIR